MLPCVDVILHAANSSLFTLMLSAATARHGCLYLAVVSIPAAARMRRVGARNDAELIRIYPGVLRSGAFTRPRPDSNQAH